MKARLGEQLQRCVEDLLVGVARRGLSVDPFT
jgi:hypothetical protein